MKELIGAWRLLRATHNSSDGEVSFHHGEHPVGQIVYSADGRMSATIMDPSWLEPPVDGKRRFGEFMAYAGAYEVQGDRVLHHVKIASHAPMVGTTLVRQFELRGNEIFLRTEPHVGKNGKTYVHELLWRRFDSETTAQP